MARDLSNPDTLKIHLEKAHGHAYMQKVTHKGSKQLYSRALLERARKLPLAKPPLDIEIDSRNRFCRYCGKYLRLSSGDNIGSL